MTIAWSPICLNAAYEPSAKPAFTGTPLTVTARSVLGIPTRKTSPAWTCPDLPSACSTAFKSGSAAPARSVVARTITTSMTTIACFVRALMSSPRDLHQRHGIHEAVGEREVAVARDRGVAHDVAAAR